MAAGLDLGKQIGPLPLGGWIAVVAGGLGIAYFINRNQSAGDDSVQLTESGTGTGGGQFIYDEPTSVDTEPLEENTNSAWGRKATNWLIGRGNSPGLADNAIRKYLSSEELSAQEQALVDQALVEFGAPPEPLAPVREIEQPPEAPSKLRKLIIFRNPSINIITMSLGTSGSFNDMPDKLHIDVKSNKGYHITREMVVTIPGTYRYNHLRPPGAAGTGYTYTVWASNEGLNGPKTIARNVHFNRYNYSPAVVGK